MTPIPSASFAEQHRPGALLPRLTPNLRVPPWIERLLQDMRLSATNLLIWGQALDALEPYLARGFEGGTLSISRLLHRMFIRLQHIPLEHSLRRPDGSEILSPPVSK